MVALVLTIESCQALINDLSPYNTAVLLQEINFKYAEKNLTANAGTAQTTHTYITPKNKTPISRRHKARFTIN